MALIEKIRKGSYRGIPFDTISIGRERVKKNTEHQYANSVRRYIEERGVQNQDFTVTLSIFGDDDYIDKRDKLRTALEQEGEGILILPLEGEFKVKCTETSDSQNITESLGRCDFICTFKVISENENAGNPIEIKNNQISLANNVKNLRSKIADVLNNNFIITNALNYQKSFTKYSDLAQQMVGIATMSTSGAGLGTIVSNFANGLSIFLGKPTLLGSAINTIFNQFEAVFDVASVLFSTSETLFAFGDTDTKVSPNTPQRIEAEKNTQLTNTQIQLNAFGIASNSFAQIEFDNEENLQNYSDKLISQLDKIEQSDFFKNTEIDGVVEITQILKEVRNNLSDLIEEKQASTPKITEVELQPESVSMLCYRYYDNLEKTEGIISLNNIQNPKSIEGKTRVYSNVG